MRALARFSAAKSYDFTATVTFPGDGQHFAGSVVQPDRSAYHRDEKGRVLGGADGRQLVEKVRHVPYRLIGRVLYKQDDDGVWFSMFCDRPAARSRYVEMFRLLAGARWSSHGAAVRATVKNEEFTLSGSDAMLHIHSEYPADGKRTEFLDADFSHPDGGQVVDVPSPTKTRPSPPCEIVDPTTGEETPL